MDAEFWHERWQLREIGFHQDQVHPFLQRFFPDLGIAKGARIFVPLCGKSLDMLWLRELGYQVVGVELSRMAIEEFFTENRLLFEVDKLAGFCRYRGEHLEIYCGDFFALTPGQTGPFAAIYDRASLVALPPNMRAGYAAHLGCFLESDQPMLTVSYDYPQEQMSGPPFSVPQAEIEQLFADRFQISKLQREMTLAQHKKMQDAGLQHLYEEVFLLTKRSSGML